MIGDWGSAFPMQVRVCACASAGLRLAYAHVVVLDGLFGEAQRAALLDLLTAPGWDETQVGLLTLVPRALAFMHTEGIEVQRSRVRLLLPL